MSDRAGKRKRETPEPEPRARIGVQFRYGNLMNNLVSVLVDAVQLSFSQMRSDIWRAYGQDVAMLALYADNPGGVWSIGLKVLRETILASMEGRNEVVFPPSARARAAMLLMASARKPKLKLPAFEGSDVEVFA